jgi:hypothetical protein
MRDRFSIIGFTEAELGFIAAILLFAAFAAKSRPAVPNSAPGIISADQWKSIERRLADAAAMKSEIAELKRGREEQVRENLLLQAELNRERSLRSRQKPSCVEKGIARGFIAEVEIAGANLFVVDGGGSDLAGVLRKLSPQLGQAKAAGCVQSIRVGYGGGVSLDDYLAARSKLARDFYVDDIGDIVR